MILRRIQSFIQADRAFFRSGGKEIAAQNRRMLIDGCIVYAAVLVFYTVMTIIADQSKLLKGMYYAFDLLHALLCTAVWRRLRRNAMDGAATQRCCALLEISVLGFFALEAVFVSRTQHSLYVPIAILLILLLYIHSLPYTCVMTFGYLASYAVLSVLYKTPEAYTNDLYIALATLASAGIGYVLIARLRHSENSVLRKYEVLSRTDSLTGLYNKSAIEAACERIVAGSERPCAFIILDLDNFKSVNDDYGHDVGDEVLKAVGRALQPSFREIDFIGRFGGDEFIVLMDNCDDPQVVTDRVEQVVGRITNLRFSVEGLRVRISAGIAMKPEGEESVQSIFRRADRALYEAKAGEGPRYRLSREEPEGPR